MKHFISKMIQTSGKLIVGVWHALRLNVRMLVAKLRGKKTFVVCIAEAHIIHVDSMVRLLARRKSFDNIAIFFVTDTNTIGSLQRKLNFTDRNVAVYSALSVRFLVFCDMMLAVWEGQVYPYFGCKFRLCTFHNQPVKGVTLGSETFNYKQINTLFFYGPLMRDLYLRKRKENPHWPSAAWYEVGQPLSDRLFQQHADKNAARSQLGLHPERVTVIYAPSFEYCSSLATEGETIIDTLLSMNVNVIVKPHPMFYISERFNQGRDGAIVGEWRDRIRKYNALSHCIFPEEAPIDSSASFAAADILVTDYSSIAFDGILRDMGLVYWHCPLFFSEYLPTQVGVTSEAVLADLSSNAGRDAGVVVHNAKQLETAISLYMTSPAYMGDARAHVREQLLFNPGRATEAAVDKIEELLGIQVGQ